MKTKCLVRCKHCVTRHGRNTSNNIRLALFSTKATSIFTAQETSHSSLCPPSCPYSSSNNAFNPIHKESNIHKHGGPPVEFAVDPPGRHSGQHRPIRRPVVSQRASRVPPAETAARLRLGTRHRTGHEAEEDEAVHAGGV